jgi:hypothetical protein
MMELFIVRYLRMVGLVVAVVVQVATGLVIQVNDGDRCGPISTHGAEDGRRAAHFHMDMVLQGLMKIIDGVLVGTTCLREKAKT